MLNTIREEKFFSVLSRILLPASKQKIYCVQAKSGIIQYSGTVSQRFYLLHSMAKYLRRNPEACRIFNRTEEELCSLRREDIIDMTDPRTSLAIEECERTGKYNGELTFVKKDGAKFTGLLVSNIFLDKSKNKQISIAIYDITGQKQTEEELHQLNRSLQAISNCNQTLLRAVDEQSLLNEYLPYHLR